ncbi:MAG TPA: YraN family protein [Candidatus Saccharimonadales bacterium]|nr:YraN family protein [Candidatus Saccharimonadales bacterium]
MTTTEIGRKAEAVAAQFLQRKGCEIIAQNWRTRFCEIDVVAQRGQTMYFCEVKYRQTNRQGSGLDYITAKKLQQMRFAAETWVHVHAWRGDYQLCAIEVSGPEFQITGAVKDL